MKRYTPLVVGVSVAGAFWLVAGSLILASWRSGLREERARDAPVCARSQVFAGAECRITLPGLLTKFTSTEMDVTIDGQSHASTVTISGPRPSTSPALPVAVTVYRGRIIHIEGETHLNVYTDAAPSTKSENYRNFGYVFLGFGAAFGTYFGVKTYQARADL